MMTIGSKGQKTGQKAKLKSIISIDISRSEISMK